VALFGTMYYAALRPSEAVDLHKDALSIPAKGWGELYLSSSSPSAGRLGVSPEPGVNRGS
jgi:hypothetical protein